jgi:hypothetical protein
MNKIAIAALIFAVLASLPTYAGDDRNPGLTPRQMAHCVMQRVKDSPGESYKTAIKTCRSALDAAASNEKGTQTAMNAGEAGGIAK